MKKTLILILSCLLIGCNSPNEASRVAMLSVSSDGRYVLTSHFGGQLILWDINKRTKKIITKHVGDFSPYIVKDKNILIWQDKLTKQIHVESLQGRKIKKYELDFDVYGHAISSDLKHYYACDANWNVYHWIQDRKTLLKPGHAMPNYKDTGTLLKMNLANKVLLTVGEGEGGSKYSLEDTIAYEKKYKNAKRLYSMWAGVMLWDAITNKPLKRFTGMSYKTVGTLSPDGKYVVACDEGVNCYEWDADSGNKIYETEYPTDPGIHCYTQQCWDKLKHDMETKKVIPDDFFSHPLANGLRTVAVKFLDEQGDYVRFLAAVNYGIVYNTKSPQVLAYLNLGKNPQPDTFSVFYSANIIDTAPKANILVMGQVPFGNYPLDKGTGIIVYKFDPKTKTLKRIWAPDGPGPHYKSKS